MEKKSIMIEKCIDKLTFFKKLDVKNAKKYFSNDNIFRSNFLRIRLFILKFFSMKNKKLLKPSEILKITG